MNYFKEYWQGIDMDYKKQTSNIGKTVTTYLIDGYPKGPQYVFFSNIICQMYVISRSNLLLL